MNRWMQQDHMVANLAMRQAKGGEILCCGNGSIFFGLRRRREDGDGGLANTNNNNNGLGRLIVFAQSSGVD